MQKAAALLVAALALACGSSAKRAPQIIAPQMYLEQLVGPSSTGYVRGPISIQYELVVENRSEESLRLRKLDLRNVGSGAYVLRGLPTAFNEIVPPMSVKRIQFWVPAVSRGGFVGGDEPVMVRGIAYFETSVGSYTHVFSQTLVQTGGDARRR